MPKRIGISKNEMMELRKQGLSNKDIANVLEISLATVCRYIGPQGGRMESLAAFNEPKPKAEETPAEETKAPQKAIDSLEMVYEVVKSADGTFRAELDYESKCASILDSLVSFEQLAGWRHSSLGWPAELNTRHKS